MVRDNELDIISGEYHDMNMVNKFKSFSNELLLTDIWRHLNGRKKEYSWCKKNPFIARRLDYILVSDQLLPFCKDSIMSDVGFSDHKVVFLNIDFSSFQRGPSFYKFNVSLLHEHILTNKIS